MKSEETPLLATMAEQGWTNNKVAKYTIKVLSNCITAQKACCKYLKIVNSIDICFSIGSGLLPLYSFSYSIFLCFLYDRQRRYLYALETLSWFHNGRIKGIMKTMKLNMAITILIHKLLSTASFFLMFMKQFITNKTMTNSKWTNTILTLFTQSFIWLFLI